MASTVLRAGASLFTATNSLQPLMRAAPKQMSQPTFHANACTHCYPTILNATRTASMKTDPQQISACQVTPVRLIYRLQLRFLLPGHPGQIDLQIATQIASQMLVQQQTTPVTWKVRFNFRLQPPNDPGHLAGHIETQIPHRIN